MIKHNIDNNPLVSYVVLSFLLMWGLASLAVFRILNINDYPILYIIGAWTPSIAAIIVTVVTFDLMTVKKLFKGWFIWKVSFGFYVAALFPLLLISSTGLISMFITQNTLNLRYSSVPILSIIELVIFNILLGPTGEQAGWRGFALRFLQRKYNAIIATLILGTIWAFWHLPMWFMPGRPESQIPFWLYTIHTIAQSFFLTWIFNSTKGSLLLAGILHLAQNLTTDLLFGLNLMPMKIGYVAIVLMDSIIAIFVLLFWGNSNLSLNKEMITEF